MFKPLDMNTIKSLRLATKALKSAADVRICRVSDPSHCATSKRALEAMLRSLPLLSEVALHVHRRDQWCLLSADRVIARLYTLQITLYLDRPGECQCLLSQVKLAPKLHTLVLSSYSQRAFRLGPVLLACSNLRRLTLNCAGMAIYEARAVVAATQLTAPTITLDDNVWNQKFWRVLGAGLS